MTQKQEKEAAPSAGGSHLAVAGVSRKPISGAQERPISVGEVIRATRRRMGFTLETLSAKAGCAKSYLSSIENSRREYAPSDKLLRKLEDALSLPEGHLMRAAQWDETPLEVKAELGRLQAKQKVLAQVVDALRRRTGDPGSWAFASAATGSGDLDEMYRTGQLTKLLKQVTEMEESDRRRMSDTERIQLPVEIPLINSVAAGYPREFTDLGYPARVADEYVRSPEVHDRDAFAARVVGDSMVPDYVEGDVVVFSPAREVSSGMDCFVRLERDEETTFKRVFFETDKKGAAVVRLQPLNAKYKAKTFAREDVAGVYAAVSVTRRIG